MISSLTLDLDHASTAEALDSWPSAWNILPQLIYTAAHSLSSRSPLLVSEASTYPLLTSPTPLQHGLVPFLEFFLPVTTYFTHLLCLLQPDYQIHGHRIYTYVFTAIDPPALRTVLGT